jgi:hypothetical protein
MATFEERFWSKVTKIDECLVWVGNKSPKGYGKFWLNGKHHRAHVIALELKLGRPIADGLQANHNCPKRNKLCMLHVYEGTQAQNMIDRAKDGTQYAPHGDDHPFAKLNAVQVRRIRFMHDIGWYTPTELAHIYKVTPTNIVSICKRKTWKHV